MPNTLPIAKECDGNCSGKNCSRKTDQSNDALLPAPEHVLSTLEHDGRRRWLFPRLAMGDLWQKRRIVAYVLMIVFVAIPHLRLGGKPLILLDIAAREFTILGQTFLPTDTFLLALLMPQRVRHDRTGDSSHWSGVVRLGLPANGLHGVSLPSHRSFVRRHDRERWQSSFTCARSASSRENRNLRAAVDVPGAHIPGVLRRNGSTCSMDA